MWVCVFVGFVICGCFMCGFCNVLGCVCVVLVTCGFVYVLVF